MKRLSLVSLFSALAFCMLNFTGGNLHSEGQIATNIPQGVQSLPTSAPSSPSSPSLSVPLGVKITSHTTGQQVPTGQLTISGTSTDTPNANCEVYTDVNDLKPMQKVAARGPGGNSDYSAWTYSYTSAYSLIKNGTNNLTSKISCIDSPTTGNLTKWNSVNLTGVDGLVLQQQPPSLISAVGNSTNNTGLLISQSAALSTFEPTVGTATPDNDNSDSDNDNSDSDNDNSDSDNDNSEESIEEENNDDDEQDNEEAEVEIATSDDEDDSEEEDNDVDLFSSENVGDETNDESATIATDANDENNDENNSDNGNPSNSEGNNDENTTDESRSASNEDNNAAENNEEDSINENNMNENSAVPTNEEPEDEAAESETNEDTEDEDECNIGDGGFPFCDGRQVEELFDDEDEDDDDCDIGDRGFPFCDGRID